MAAKEDQIKEQRQIRIHKGERTIGVPQKTPYRKKEWKQGPCQESTTEEEKMER